MVHKLAVWLFENRVGTLESLKGKLSFCYDIDWLKRADSVPLSCSLPLQEGPFNDELTRSFFAGLLPEGQMRHLISKQSHVSEQNDFALLDIIGGECAGAVTLIKTDQSLFTSAKNQDIQWLNDEEVVTTLTELPHRPMLAGKEGLRLSLAGAQDKLPVVFDGQRIGLPKNGTPSSHILKPPIHGIEESVVNEGFCLALAETLQLKTASSKIHTVLGHKFLLVERYDRIIDVSGSRRRLHQEDFCQALGIVPEMKYQNEGGPNLTQCFELLRRVTQPSAPQILSLLDYVIFNALIGNHDAHGKNFSLLYLGEMLILAPAYDILCTAIYPTLTPKMAMKIGSKYKFNDLYGQHWDQFSQSVGLAKGQTRRRIHELAESIPKAAQELQINQNYEFLGSPFIERVVTLIKERCNMTIRRLVNSSDSI